MLLLSSLTGQNVTHFFVIEESPAYRCRAVEGPKKINKVVIKVSNPLEIEYLLARDDNQAKAISKGKMVTLLRLSHQKMILFWCMPKMIYQL